MKSPISKAALAPNSPSAPPPDRLGRARLPAGTFDLARALIGAILVRRLDDGTIVAGRIVETEAYGLDDPSSHAFRGPTRRNRSMFLRHAHVYVYLIYGTSYCLNIATEGEGLGAAILVRAVEPLTGLDRMRSLRGRAGVRDYELARGPGNLCRAFGIGPDLDGADLDVDERIWIAPGEPLATGTSVRIGLTKAADFPHRYYARGSRSVSGPRSLSP